MPGRRLRLAGEGQFIEDETGLRQHCGFIGAAGGRIFVSLHTGRVDPAAAVLVCSPVFVEGERNYRREVLLGRALAARGVACVRFHYRGTGNSDSLAAVTPSTMTDDARHVLEELVKLRFASIGLVGTRSSAPTALALRGDLADGPVALWSPVLDLSRWAREVRRAARVAALGEPASSHEPGDAPDLIDAMGYGMSHTAFTNAAAVALPTRRALIVEFDGKATNGRESCSTVDRLEFSVEHSWWFLDHDWTAEEERRQIHGLVFPTADWLSQQLA
jgi:hypothetical protein